MKTQRADDYAGCLVVIVILAVGLLLTLSGVGAIFGIPAMILALLIVPIACIKRTKVWLCPSCRVVIPRG